MKICLIGSTRFIDKFISVNHRLSLAGHVVYSVAAVSTSYHKFVENVDNKSGRIETAALTPAEKETLDLVHLRKIQESEEVFVITDETGYVGDSTKREIKWAMMNGLEIHTGDHYLNQHLCAGVDQALGKMREYIKKTAAAEDTGPCREKGGSGSLLGDLLSNSPEFVVMMGGRRPGKSTQQDAEELQN